MGLLADTQIGDMKLNVLSDVPYVVLQEQPSRGADVVGPEVVDADVRAARRARTGGDQREGKTLQRLRLNEHQKLSAS